MANLYVIKSVNQEDIDKRDRDKNKLQELINKYHPGDVNVDTSRFFPEEFTISKGTNEVARINLPHHVVGVVTPSLPSWLMEVILDIENQDSIDFDIYVNNEKD